MFSSALQRAYPSDLTDAQWEILEPLIPPLSPEAVYHKHERRTIVNAILYVLRSGCPWRALPHDLLPYGTVFYYFRRWQRLISLRTKEALAAKKKQGVRLGKPKGTLQKSKSDADLTRIKELLKLGLSVRKIATLLGYTNHHALNTYITKRQLREQSS